ncbi:MAG TPA: hypothetical protein DEH78_04815 [Solibacterales bacterium]|nr:hypothetical protein [Bryobacterales bacterium]
MIVKQRLTTAILLLPALFAQDKPPVAVVEKTMSQETNDPRLHLTLKNESNKRIEAIVIRMDFLSAPGAQTDSPARRAFTAIYGLRPDSPVISPSTQWKLDIGKFPKTVSGEALPLKSFTIDYVRLAGGDYWGPDTMRQAERIAGVFDGFRMAQPKQ